METQKNRQRRAGEASSTGRERDRDKERDICKTSTSEAALPALMETSSMEGAGLLSDPEPADLEEKLEEIPGGSLMQTPVFEVSSVELVTLSIAQVSPCSQLSEAASDTEVPEAIEAAGPVAESGGNGDALSGKEEPQTDEDKDPKKSKAHLHCPVCKVTVNSTSQMDAHNTGKKKKKKRL
ncbi:Zinc finger protein 385C [Liparis tanakae]|uniref:Zinc finger protein 385C n=1 Tax=Liparis tanakae TaxID=230148 RepID=A0A4Z2J8G3_9TELE|nr:Zinc finger protein 385C [Liparis tanakae]